METKKPFFNADDVEKTYDVFICYSRKDLDVVKPIKEELEANGFSCWTDLEGIESGSEAFTRQIVEAIGHSSVFLFILSGNSQNSQWAINELRYARRSHKSVVIVRPNGDAMTDEFAFEFVDFDTIDWRRLEQRQKLLRDMHTWLGETDTRAADGRTKAQIPLREKLVRHLADNSPHDIFISYSRKNKGLVLPIKEEIERTLGLKCWIDLSDIPCGSENFKKRVIPGIRQTRTAFLFFLTVESQASEYAMKEINFAKKRANKRVILIRINDDDMTDEFAFDFQDADIIDWRQPEQKAKLLRDLRLWADEANETHSPTATQKTSAESVKTQPEGSFVVCPICGRKNRPVDTFRCRECGQDNLCLRHQDEATFLCLDCKARTMHGGVGDLYSPRFVQDPQLSSMRWKPWAETESKDEMTLRQTSNPIGGDTIDSARANQFDVFISYSRRDLDVVKPIKEELERNGFSCWMDIDGIESGDENFKQKIVPAIDGCCVVLFFISAFSQKSEWTAKELGYAKRHGKRVVPLRFNDDSLVGVFDFDYGDADIIDWRRAEQRAKLLVNLQKRTQKLNDIEVDDNNMVC